MRGNMNKKRVTEIFFLDTKNECTFFRTTVADRIDYFISKHINGKASRWPGEMRLYFSDDLWSYVWLCRYCNQHDVFQFRDHIFWHGVHRDCALGTNKMRIEYIWEEEMGPDKSYLEQFKGIWAVQMNIQIKPKKVIFHNPATIVFWNDGTKTVVKRQKGDRWDPEKGLAMAYIKKFIGLKEFYRNL